MIMVVLAIVDDDDALDVSKTLVEFDVVHVLNQVLQDCIRDSGDEDELAVVHTVDKVNNKFVVVVVVRKQPHLFHDHMDMNRREHNNLYFQKSHYMNFFV